jgi:hypothetical protein
VRLNVMAGIGAGFGTRSSRNSHGQEDTELAIIGGAAGIATRPTVAALAFF